MSEQIIIIHLNYFFYGVVILNKILEKIMSNFKRLQYFFSKSLNFFMELFLQFFRQFT
jgi:hypothetical protein